MQRAACWHLLTFVICKAQWWSRWWRQHSAIPRRSLSTHSNRLYLHIDDTKKHEACICLGNLFIFLIMCCTHRATASSLKIGQKGREVVNKPNSLSRLSETSSIWGSNSKSVVKIQPGIQNVNFEKHRTCLRLKKLVRLLKSKWKTVTLAGQTAPF